MYEKTMYKVTSKNNKVIYRLQDFTKNDNVNESLFVEATNTKGATRLQCQVKVLHLEEFEALQHKATSLKQHVEDLTDKIKQQNNEIKRLQGEVDEYERAHKDEEFNIMLETRKLEKQHQNELDELKETYSNDLHDIDETHRKHLENMSAQYNAKVNELNNKVLSQVQANKETTDKLNGEMLAIKDTHKQEVITLQNTHHKELEKLQHAHSNELQTLQEQHTYDINKLKQALADIKQEHLVEVKEINEKHHVEVEQIRSTFMKLLASEHAKDLSDLNECEHVPLLARPFARAHIKALNEFKKRKYMNTPQKIVESYEHVQHLNE